MAHARALGFGYGSGPLGVGVLWCVGALAPWLAQGDGKYQWTEPLPIYLRPLLPRANKSRWSASVASRSLGDRRGPYTTPLYKDRVHPGGVVGARFLCCGVIRLIEEPTRSGKNWKKNSL